MGTISLFRTKLHKPSALPIFCHCGTNLWPPEALGRSIYSSIQSHRMWSPLVWGRPSAEAKASLAVRKQTGHVICTQETKRERKEVGPGDRSSDDATTRERVSRFSILPGWVAHIPAHEPVGPFHVQSTAHRPAQMNACMRCPHVCNQVWQSLPLHLKSSNPVSSCSSLTSNLSSGHCLKAHRLGLRIKVWWRHRLPA